MVLCIRRAYPVSEYLVFRTKCAWQQRLDGCRLHIQRYTEWALIMFERASHWVTVTVTCGDQTDLPSTFTISGLQDRQRPCIADGYKVKAARPRAYSTCGSHRVTMHLMSRIYLRAVGTMADRDECGHPGTCGKRMHTVPRRMVWPWNTHHHAFGSIARRLGQAAGRA